MRKNWILLVGAIAFLAGCSTKVDLNADWKDTTIIYGLLDQTDDYHFIKINKAFLGEGNYYDYAMIRDSSEYQNVNAYIQELSNGLVVNTYPLRDTVLSNREPGGIFYGPEQTVYYFRKTGLSPINEYRLVAKLNEGTSKEKEVSGETSLVKDFNIINMSSISVGSFDGTTSSYTRPTVKFFPPDNASSFEVVWRLKWDEYSATGTVRKTYDWLIGSTSSAAALPSGQIEFEVNGEAFFRTIGSVIQPDPLVTKRIFRSVDVIVYAASEDLETYININKPQSGLVQERPEFTNISNGLGLFSSRLHKILPNRLLPLGPYRELAHGQYTSHLLFCTDTTATSFTLAAPPTVVCD